MSLPQAALRDVVVHVDDETLSPRTLAFAARLAGETGAELRAVLPLPPAGGLGALEPEAAALAEQTAQAFRTARRAFAADLTARVGATHHLSIALVTPPGRPVNVLQHAARTTDLVVVSQRPPDGHGGLTPIDITQLVMGAGAPVIVVPHIGWPTESPDAADGTPLLQRVLVAWSGTRESARAARDALPLLRRAAHVELVAVQSQRDDAATRSTLESAESWLRGHGVDCATAMLPPVTARSGLPFAGGGTDVTVGEALLSYAADAQADLLVMGAYGHSRLWEFVLGGVTRTILGSMTLPVLLSH